MVQEEEFAKHSSLLEATMSEKHIMLVVLAENQSERLARCLKSIQHQEIPAEAKISLIVAGGDTAVIKAALAEVDLTAQMLESSSTGTNTQADLLAAVAEQIPETADWVWALSSNDWLHSKTAIATAIDAAWSEDALSGSVGLVHLCAADKSLDTGEMFVNTLSDLCSAFGFTEMLGNISSLMMQRYIFQIAFGRHFRTALDASVEDADAEGAGGVRLSCHAWSAVNAAGSPHSKSASAGRYARRFNLLVPRGERTGRDCICSWRQNTMGPSFFQGWRHESLAPHPRRASENPPSDVSH